MSIELRDHGDPLAPHSVSAAELRELLAVERAGRPLLAFRDRLGPLLLFVVPSTERAVTVGRRLEMDLAIPWDHEVSGLHAELHLFGEELTIVDDGLSTNGTYVNGERINGRRRLRDGDRIRVGQTVLAYKIAGDAIVFPTVAAVDVPERPRLTETQRRVLIALCRPVRERDGFVTPATNRQIAEELFLSVDAVKMHLRTLFAKFDLTSLTQNRKRAELARCALQFGIISPRELD
jgi:hypothetical protein